MIGVWFSDRPATIEDDAVTPMESGEEPDAPW